MKNSFIVLLISLFLLSGCDGDRCIAPDDFGFIKYTISSRYAKKDLNTQVPGMQIAPWLDSGYKVNGQPLVITVKPWDPSSLVKSANNSDELSAWCAWFGQESNNDTLSTFCSRLRDCEFSNNDMCKEIIDEKRITNAPCLFRKGVGLYFLIAAKGTNPNATFLTMRAPTGITGHIGEPRDGFQFFDLNKVGSQVDVGGVSYKYDPTIISKDQIVDSPLYFKILDKFYEDNNGQYKIVIKSGVSDTSPDPLQFVTKLIKDELFGANKSKPGLVQKIYQGIIDTPGYRLSVSALLTMYIMFTGISFLTGNVNLTHTELITRAVKVTFISILINSQQSWSFFHDYLFVFFVEGLDQIIDIINKSASTGSGPSTILGLMIAPQTMAKLFSLLFYDPLGFIYIILFLIALYFIFMMVFKATIIYLTALIAIGMILTMAPIFICFVMFDITRSLFENWLKQLISYALQPIILFTGLAFISMLIQAEIYNSLGFGICKYDFPNLGNTSDLFSSAKDLDPSINTSLFYWWFPSPMKSENFTKTKANILVPIDHIVNDGSKDGKLCEAYQCVENRYIELPYLVPENDQVRNDQDRINSFFGGRFVQFDGLLLIFVCVYLLSKFNGMSISLAKFISSTSGNLTNIQSVGHSAFAPIQQGIEATATKASNSVKESVKERVKENKYVRELDKAYTEKFGKGGISGWANEGINNKFTKGVEKQALGSSSWTSLFGSSKSVLAEVKKKYGVEQKDVNVNAQSDYEDGIRKSLKTLGVPDKDIDAKVEALSGKSFPELRDELTQISLKGKSKGYTNCTEEQKAEIDKLLNTKYNEKTIRELASDASFTKDFQKMYLDAHQKMSARGIGAFGKKFAMLRSLKEMNNRIDDKRSYKSEKERAIGERLYAGYEGLKRDALTAIVGKDLVNAYEGSMTGAAWHDFDYRDPALRTYNEKLKDEQIQLEAKNRQTQINKEIVSNGEDILSPEYHARLKQQGRTADVESYKKLAQEKLQDQVYDRFHTKDEPVIMGEKFMAERATDSQLRMMVDNSYGAQSELIQNDWYIRRQEKYDIMHDNAATNIMQKYELLTKHYDLDAIKAEDVPSLLEKYYKETNDGTVDAKKEVDNLKASMNDFKYSKEVLENIEERKVLIKDSVRTYIKEIHKHRENSKMPKYVEPDQGPEQGGRTKAGKMQTLQARLDKSKRTSAT